MKNLFVDIDVALDTPTEDIQTMRERIAAKGTPEMVQPTGAQIVALLDQILHLRWQRDSLQEHGSKLAMRNQRLRMKELAGEELHREISRLVERVVTLERVAEKLFDECGAENLTEEECYVLEAINNPPTR